MAKGPLLFWITADPRVTISILAASVIGIGHKPASVKTLDNSQSASAPHSLLSTSSTSDRDCECDASDASCTTFCCTDRSTSSSIATASASGGASGSDALAGSYSSDSAQALVEGRISQVRKALILCANRSLSP